MVWVEKREPLPAKKKEKHKDYIKTSKTLVLCMSKGYISNSIDYGVNTKLVTFDYLQDDCFAYSDMLHKSKHEFEPALVRCTGKG